LFPLSIRVQEARLSVSSNDTLGVTDPFVYGELDRSVEITNERRIDEIQR